MCCVFYQHRPNIENPLLKMLSKCHSTLTPFPLKNGLRQMKV
jgi:hypothetical protein